MGYTFYVESNEVNKKILYMGGEMKSTYDRIINKADNGKKYHHELKGVIGGNKIDIYGVIETFGVKDASIQHAIKKLLCAGNRSKATKIQDLEEAVTAIVRGIEVLESEIAKSSVVEPGEIDQVDFINPPDNNGGMFEQPALDDLVLRQDAPPIEIIRSVGSNKVVDVKRGRDTSKEGEDLTQKVKLSIIPDTPISDKVFKLAVKAGTLKARIVGNEYKIKLKDDLEYNAWYGGVKYNDFMIPPGHEVTYHYDNKDGSIKIKEDGYVYSLEMFDHE
jgi:hypothetical protein